MSETLDVGIVGAGPVALAAAIAARRHDLRARCWDRGALCDAILHYPTNMVFFTTNELLEIGGHPLVSGGPKATRREALDYYRKVAEREELDVETFSEVVGIEMKEGGFRVRTVSGNRASSVSCRAVVVATGYYHRPRVLGIPGEELPHVSHYFLEPHPYWRRRVVIVGAGNSAAEAALELYRGGAHVTLVARSTRPRDTIKYWVRPDLENRIREGVIGALFEARVTAIRPAEDVVERDGEASVLAADAVFLLTGFCADPALARDAGAEVRGDGSVVLSPAFETTVPGLFVIGSAGFGARTNEVFIENGRAHACAAVDEIAARLARPATPPSAARSRG